MVAACVGICCCCCSGAICWNVAGAGEILPCKRFGKALRFLGAALRIPSRIRMRRTLGGKSSIFTSTRMRHSGHRSSLWVLTISSKHFLQNVCWHGSTLLEVSSRSRHTEHSNKSFNVHSSILLHFPLKNLPVSFPYSKFWQIFSQILSWNVFTEILSQDSSRYMQLSPPTIHARLLFDNYKLGLQWRLHLCDWQTFNRAVLNTTKWTQLFSFFILKAIYVQMQASFSPKS